MTEQIKSTLTPTRPYMVRAIYQWLEDNSLTVYLMVDATHKNAKVPTEFVQDGRIVLNIGSTATGALEMSNDYINFKARFGGVEQEIWVPMQAVMGIYAKEDQTKGIVFDSTEYDNYTPEESIDSSHDSLTSSKRAKRSSRPKRENTAGLQIRKK